MCPPLIAVLPQIMAGLAATSAAVSAFATNQSAKAQASAIGVQQENERRETLERGEEELGQRVRAAREARSRARVAAGESGALGASFAASINQSISDQDNDAALIQKNVAFSQRATDDRANTALSSIRKVSALEAGLSIGSAGLSGFSSGLSLKKQAGG